MAVPQATRYSVALVVATQRLLAAALREPRNQRFVVLSESCASVSDVSAAAAHPAHRAKRSAGSVFCSRPPLQGPGHDCFEWLNSSFMQRKKSSLHTLRLSRSRSGWPCGQRLI